MRRMNNGRVNFKHHGSIPSATDLDQFRGDVTTFFTDATRAVFGADFTSIDMTDLVTQQEALDKIRDAETRSGQWQWSRQVNGRTATAVLQRGAPGDPHAWSLYAKAPPAMQPGHRLLRAATGNGRVPFFERAGRPVLPAMAVRPRRPPRWRVVPRAGGQSTNPFGRKLGDHPERVRGPPSIPDGSLSPMAPRVGQACGRSSRMNADRMRVNVCGQIGFFDQEFLTEALCYELLAADQPAHGSGPDA